MRKVFDFECDLPPDENAGRSRKFETATLYPGYGDPERMEPPPGYGFANYNNIIFRRGAPDAGSKKAPGMSLDDFVAQMDDADVETGLVGRVKNEELGRIIKAYPCRFRGMASISPFDGMCGVREFERCIREYGLYGLRIAALFNGVPASDRRFYPLHAKCVNHVPVRIYASMNYANDRPYDLGHPRHIDQVAMDFRAADHRALAAGRGSTTWWDCCDATRTSFCDTAAHHPRCSPSPAPAGRCSCSSATR